MGCLSTPFRDKFLQDYTETMQLLLSKMLKEYASIKEVCVIHVSFTKIVKITCIKKMAKVNKDILWTCLSQKLIFAEVTNLHVQKQAFCC